MDLIDKNKLLDLVPYSMTHIYRLESTGRFPKRVKLGSGRGGRVAWVRSEVLSWVNSHIECR